MAPKEGLLRHWQMDIDLHRWRRRHDAANSCAGDGGALKQQMVIDNRGGAHGNIATEIVVNARPDGYTLLFGMLGTLVINPLLYKSLSFAPARDLAPVAMLVSFANVVLVHPSVGANRRFLSRAGSASQAPGERHLYRR
jgi:Tripartite tricarboxylate transporter family receptor